VAAPPVRAAAPGYEFQLGVIESDNIERLPAGGTSATIGVEELGFDWHDKGPWLDADIDADVSHLDYFPHVYTDEFIGNLLGVVKVNLVPDLLSWNVNDNFGQAPLAPLAPITPDNRENINYFSTGPTLTLPLGRATFLDVSGAYGRVDYQVSPLDSTRLLGSIALLHELSTDTNISLNASDDNIRFANEEANPNYQRQDAFARFAMKGSRTEVGIDLGYGRLDMPGIRFDTPVARLDLSRKLSPDSTLGLALGHDYSDGADTFRVEQGIGGATPNTQPVVAAAAPFVSNYGTLAWNFKYQRTTLDLSLAYFKDRYQTDATLNNERTVFAAVASRQVTPVMQLSLTEYLVRWQFDSTDESATESDTGLQLTWRAGTHLTVRLSYFLAKGTSNVYAFQYTENRVWLSLGWGVAAEAPPGPAPVRLPGRD
jgi:hypothetical protein